ncbi:MAG TPA: bifunctional oligoribonuclease/PAP phosphatase NrnA [Bacteroidales bacterium]|nr:bifunctional oligoribonuclease/PAP phosphatase NrnA [Bacteroidales bacterium]
MNTLDKNHICKFICTDPQNVVVVSHTSPDGDAIGSALAMQKTLTAFGHHAVAILPDVYPDYYSWLPGVEDIVIAENEFDKALQLIANASLQVIVDMNALKRGQIIEKALEQADAKRILIDHHILTNNIFDAAYSTPDVSSTSELVYNVIEALNPALITKDVAECIYTGIVTDTANFFHGNMSPRTFDITANLMRKNIDIIKINQVLYHTFSENRIRLLGFSISERLHLLSDFHAAYIYLNKEDLIRFNYSEGDSEDIVNYGLAIKGIHISAFFIEKTDFIKISLRSEGDINVNAMASKYFNGGGHKNASGAHFYGSLTEAISLYEQALREL